MDATRLAGRLLGDSISSNIFLMGYAYQSGLLPLGAQSIRRAIELNGVAIAVDVVAFGDLDAFGAQVDALAAALTALPKAEGVEQIFAPGERGDSVLAEREEGGIPLPAGTWSRLGKVAGELGIALPAGISGS